MKFLRFSNNPIVGRYVECGGLENVAIEAALTEQQKTTLRYVGWVEIAYAVGNIRWPGAVIRVAD